MTMRDDVREYFERESRRIPTPPGLRAEVTARAGEPPARAQSLRWAAVLAAVLAFAIIAGLLAVSQLRHDHAAVPGRVQVGAGQTEGVLDISPVDELRAWVLIAVCNPDMSKCQAWVESTSDGGRTWGSAVKVGPAFDGLNGDTLRHIHFATATDGFIYGLGVAYVTRDAGKTWSRMPSDFSDLQWITGFATVWELVEPCPLGTQCPMAVRTSVDAGRTWSVAAALTPGMQLDQMVAFGPSGLLLAGEGKGDMVITFDNGRTWHSIAGRCAPGNAHNSAATSDGSEIWQVCGTEPKGLNVTTDGGLHWVALHNPASGIFGPFVVSPKPGIAFITASTTNAGVVPDLLVSQDRGETWQPVPDSRGFAPIVFCETGEAWTIDLGGHAWVSTDFGLTWEKRAQP